MNGKLEGPIAVIADVHGNRWALESVLADIHRRGIADVLNLGDSLYGPLDPAGTVTILRDLAPPSVRGNQDRILLEPDEATRDSPTFRFVNDQLAPDDVAWLAEHQIAPVQLGGLVLCHGDLQRDDRYLLEEVTAHAVTLRDPQTLARDLAEIHVDVCLCAHSHVPRLVGLAGGRLVVNPGSVGLPAYSHDSPFPHAMQAGSPHARYSILERTGAGWSVVHVALAYDWESAAAAAARHDRPDWAEWLRSGRARPE